MTFESDIFRLLMIVLLLANDRHGESGNFYTDINQMLILALILGSCKYPTGRREEPPINTTVNNLTANNMTANNMTATNMTATNLSADTLAVNHISANSITTTTPPTTAPSA